MVDKKIVEKLKFKTSGNNKKYKIQGICDYAVYGKELEVEHLLNLYYLDILKKLFKRQKYMETYISSTLSLKIG